MLGLSAACLVSGVTIGLLLPTVLAVAITSLQLILIFFGLWISNHISGHQLFLWLVVGISIHQSAYLAAVIWRTGRLKEPDSALKFELEKELDLMDSLAQRIGARAPEVESEAATLAALARKIRQVLMSENQLATLLLENRRQS